MDGTIRLECANCGQHVQVWDADRLRYASRPADHLGPSTYLIIEDVGSSEVLVHACEIDRTDVW